MTRKTISTYVIAMGIVYLALLLLTAMTATATGVNMMVQFVSAQGDASEEYGEDTPSGTSDEVTPTAPIEEPSDDGDMTGANLTGGAGENATSGNDSAIAISEKGVK
jgi:hypothetical protein